MRIYLIGMPGCGKSTLGKKLAKKMNYKFIDMDNYIERQAGMFIDELFEAYGEEFFRSLETNTLKELAKFDDVVIATGGGIIKNKQHKEIMDGKCIYLNVNLEDLQRRINESPIIRPLLKTKSINDLYNERKELYDYFADIIINNDNIEEAIDHIVSIL